MATLHTATRRVPPEWIATANMLIERVAFISEALQLLPLINEPRVPIAGTDGACIGINPTGYEAFRRAALRKGLPWFASEATARAVLLLHEPLHVVLRSKERRLWREPELWNKAADYVINLIVVELLQQPPFSLAGNSLAHLKAVMAAVGCYDERFKGMSKEEVYAILEEERRKQQEQQQTQSAPQKCEDDVEASPDEEEPGQPESNPSEENPPEDEDQDEEEDDEEFPPDDGSGAPSGSQEDGVEEEEEEPQPGDGFPGEDFGEAVPEGDIPEDLRELVAQQLEDYMERNGGRLAGVGTTAAKEAVIAAVKPPVSMEEIVKKIRDTEDSPLWSYMRPGRYGAWIEALDMPFRLPATTPQPGHLIRQILIAIDCSGSMSIREKQAAVGIFQEAFKYTNREVRVLQVASTVGADDILKPGEDINFRVSGGTCMSSIIPYIKEKRYDPSLVVLITDGDLPPNDPPEFARWRMINRLRTVVVRNRHTFDEMPGIKFFADLVRGGI